MLLSEKFLDDEGTKFVVKKTYDFTPVVDDVKRLKDAGAIGSKDNWLVGRIPAPLLGMWIKEAGLSWDDTAAVQDLIKRKLLSSEYNALRPHEGSF